MEKNLNQLKTESIGKLLLQYAIPSIIGLLVTALYMVVDRMFIGNIKDVGTATLSALGATIPVSNIIMAFSGMIAVGVATNISLKLGQKKKEDAQFLLGNAITLSVVISILLSIVGLIFIDELLLTFGASKATLVHAKPYLRIILGGCVFGFLALTLSSTVRVDGSPKISTGIMLVGCIMNIFLDWLFIFPLGWGIKGAAIATLISQATSVTLGFIYHASKRANLKVIKTHFKLKAEYVKTIVTIGLTPFIIHMSISATQATNNIFLKMHGQDLAIAAMTVIGSIGPLLLMPIFGLNQGMQPIVGYNYGAKMYGRTRDTYSLASFIGICYMLIATALVLFFAKELVSIFNKDPNLVALASRGLREYAFMGPLYAFNIIAATFILSVGKAKEAMFLSITRLALFTIPFIIFLSSLIGVDGVWLAEPAAAMVSAFFTAIILRKELKHQKSKMLITLR